MSEENLIITIVGGGSTYTPGIIQAILKSKKVFPVKEIRLYDNDQERNHDMFLIIQLLLTTNQMQAVTLVETVDPEIAFKGADFIFSQIRVGGLAMREQDEKIPLKYGLVGQETCGVGGFAYGLRSLGGLLTIVEDIQQHAPNAWILNYTNPESIISEGIRRAFPNINMLNACDMTISIEETIALNYGYDRKNWISTYYGLNHFGWYRSIYDNSLGRDVMPEIIKKIQTTYLRVADFNKGDEAWQAAFEMMSVMVRNFPDYLPNNYLEYYLYPDMIVEEADVNYTRANMVMEGREKKTKRMAAAIKAGETRNVLDFNFGEHGQYIVDMAVSILKDQRRRFMLLLPNRGSIPNLRSDAVVEIPAYVGATGPEAISLEPINDFHKGLMEAQVAAEKLLVDAFFEGSYQKALQAFTLNQTVPSARIAKQVLDEMMIANGDYWPKLR
ncbi:maltose-6'-phosphate glucosidase [Vagococcus sp. BWB3-3]|uniref:Maltose-6'-phosphate glucosidase n=1 Tax=Vagococcus allomyrinae TaxID=2794353 RepID=A0A940PAG8_9ENTE|nr:maltose-6'-phosphate glucosidase [Vagococcus allomyrinae]MBP1044015.1 maltose-6'-phosphate glucosidase [Vagococcus allomyrinae]